MRLLLAGLASALAACSLLQQAPDAASPTSPSAPPEAGQAAAAPANAAGTPTPAGAGEVAPAPPGVALRYTLHLPSVAGRPWTRQHLEVKVDGAALWESDTGGGDGDVTEALTEKPNASRKVVRCAKRLDPLLQRKLVDAARRAMSSGCSQDASPIDAASTTIALAWQGESKACTVTRSGGGYLAFEQARTEAVAQLCKP